MMEEQKKGIIFVEDEIDLKIFQLAKKLKILDNNDLECLSAVCCNYHLLKEARSIFSDAKYIFNMVDIDNAQCQDYRESIKAALLFFEKTKNGRYAHLHYSLLFHLQRIFYDILISKTLIKTVLHNTGANFLVLLPRRKLPTILYKKWRFQSQNSIFGAVLNDFCRENGRNFIRIKKISWVFGAIASPRALFQFLPGEALLERFLLIWRKNKAAPARKKEPQKPATRKAIVINWGVDLVRHTTITDLAAKIKPGDSQIVHLLWQKNEKPPALPPKQHIFYKKSLRFYLLGSGFFSAIFKTLKALAECLSVLREKDFFQGKFYSKDLFFAYFFLYFYGTPIVEGYRKWLSGIFSKFSAKLFITSDIPNHIGRILVFTAREWKVKLYTFSHGCPLYLPWPDTQSRLGDKILVSGQAVSALMQKAGVGQDRIIVVGDKKRPLPVPSFPKKEGLKTVAVIMAMKMGRWTEHRNKTYFFKTVESLTDALLKAGFNVTIKSHKIADYWEFYDQLVESYQNYPIQHIRRRWRKDEFLSCNAAIFPGSIVSTAVLDCQAAGIPVIFIDILSKVEKEVLRCDYRDCGVMVNSSGQAVESVKNLFTDEEYFKNVCEKGRRFYKDHVNIEKDFGSELAKIVSQFKNNEK